MVMITALSVMNWKEPENCTVLVWISNLILDCFIDLSQAIILGCQMNTL